MQAYDAEAVSSRPAGASAQQRSPGRGSSRPVCIRAPFRSAGRSIRSVAGKWSESLHRVVQDDEKSGCSEAKPLDPKHSYHIEDARKQQESDEFRHARVQVLLPLDPPEDTCQPCREGSEP